MSQYGYLHQLTPSFFLEILKDPQIIEQLINASKTDIEEFLEEDGKAVSTPEKFLAEIKSQIDSYRMNPAMLDDYRDVIEQRETLKAIPGYYDGIINRLILGKSWAFLDEIIRSIECDQQSIIAKTITGGTEIIVPGEGKIKYQGYYLISKEVKEVSAALNRLTIKQMRTGFKPIFISSHLEFWSSLDEKTYFKERIQPNMNRIRAFYQQAAANKNFVLSYWT